MAITDAMQRELARVARAANRRLERASEGQRAALDYYLRGYHTREGARGTVFQQGRAKTEREYRARMAELEAFMSGESTTRRGWKELKEENISKAGETLRGRGYDLKDEELAQILIETGGAKKVGKAFYKALNNVQAARNKKAKSAGDDFTGLTSQEITEAISSRASGYEATLAALKK